MKFKSIIGISILFLIFVWSFISCYIGVIGFLTGNIPALIYFVFLMYYQIFHAKYSQKYVDFISYFQPQEYFDEFSLYQEENLKKEKCILGFHPHGVLSIGLIGNINLKIKNVNILASRFALFVPFLGLTLKWWNALPVSHKYFIKYLKQGKNIALVPGGYEEATLTERKQNIIYIKKRKGFIKYAIQNGYTVYPVFTFNENQLFYTFNKFLSFRLWLNKFKFIGTFFFSPYFWLLPIAGTKLHTVIGKGIELKEIKHPSQNEIDFYHQKYVSEVNRIFYQYKDKYGVKGELVIN